MLIDEDFLVKKQNTKGYLAHRGSMPQEKELDLGKEKGLNPKRVALYEEKNKASNLAEK